MSAALSRFPCHPDLPVRAGAWASCPECGTRLHVGTGAPPVHLVYDERYPTERGHHDPSVGRCKVRSLERWLGALGLDPAHQTSSELAFGRAVVVAPDARSASHSLLGPLWPHNSADHRIHYTRAGVEALFGREGFRLLRTFRPVKCLSPGMVIRHLGVLRGRPTPAASGALSRWTVWFNIGEMGLLLGRDAHRP